MTEIEMMKLAAMIAVATDEVRNRSGASLWEKREAVWGTFVHAVPNLSKGALDYASMQRDIAKARLREESERRRRSI